MVINAIGLITLTASVYALSKNLVIAKQWISATGRTIDRRLEKTSDPTQPNEIASIEFMDLTGQTIKAECSWIFKSNYKENKNVAIRYNPRNPSEIRLKWWVTDWGAFAAMAAIGIALLMTGHE